MLLLCLSLGIDSSMPFKKNTCIDVMDSDGLETKQLSKLSANYDMENYSV